MSLFRRAGAEILRVIERALDPSAEADRVLLYSKDVAGVTQLFARGSDGTINPLTPVAVARSIAVRATDLAVTTGFNVPWDSSSTSGVAFDGTNWTLLAGRKYDISASLKFIFGAATDFGEVSWVDATNTPLALAASQVAWPQSSPGVGDDESEAPIATTIIVPVVDTAVHVRIVSGTLSAGSMIQSGRCWAKVIELR